MTVGTRNAKIGGMVCKVITHKQSHDVANCRTKSQTRINEWMPVIAKQSMCSYTTSIYSITDVALDNRGCTLCSRKCARTDDTWEQCVHEYLCERQQCVRAMSRKNDSHTNKCGYTPKLSEYTFAMTCIVYSRMCKHRIWMKEIGKRRKSEHVNKVHGCSP